MRDIKPKAAIAQLGERQTEYLKVPNSFPGLGICPSLVDLGFLVSSCYFSPAYIMQGSIVATSVGPSPREAAFHRYYGLLLSVFLMSIIYLSTERLSFTRPTCASVPRAVREGSSKKICK